MTFEDLPLYDLSEIPEDDILEWRYPKMTKVGMKGETRVWEGAILNGGIVTLYGQKGGKMIQSEPYEIETNSSGRNFQEQAALQLQAKYELKFRKEGYRREGDKEMQQIQAMLANSWEKRNKNTILYFPVIVQPKLDGIRCLVNYDRMSCKLKYRSRTNKYWDFGYLFDEEINSMMPFFPVEVQFDGELYVHGEFLQKIASIVSVQKTEEELEGKKDRKSKEDLETLKLRKKILKYNIFTVIAEKKTYEERREMLLHAYESGQRLLGRKFEKVTIVDDNIVDDQDEIDFLLDDYVHQGYEGIMIYKLGKSLPKNKISESYYKPGRSWNLIKVKAFEDEEMEIIEINSGKGKAADLAKTKVIDSQGITHEVVIAKEDEIRKKILQEPDEVIGKMATVKHYGRTKDGKLRHANVVAIRDYE